MMMTADSLQTRIFRKVDGQLLHVGWWLKSLILDAQTLLHFGQTKVLVKDDWDAACSFCLLCFPLQLYVSLTRTYNWLSSLMSTCCLNLRPPAVTTDG